MKTLVCRCEDVTQSELDHAIARGLTTIEELKRFRDRLSPKHQYLADAPASDPDGNPAIVRFSRKTKEQ